MLRGIHKASANWLGRIFMGVILGLIAISFGIWGIGDIFRGFGQSTVAKVGDTEIRVETFRQFYNDRLQQLARQVGRPILPDQARALGLDRQFLGQVIAENAIDERVRSMGLNLTDAEVARRVTQDPNFRGLGGQFDRLRFEQIIRQSGYTEARYLDEQRRMALRKQLISSLTAELAAPSTAVDAFNRYRNEQRTIEYVLLGPAQAGEVAAPTPEQLAKYFEDHKASFRAPEYRKVELLVVTPDELVATIEVSDADLKRAYEERKARFATPERRHVLQMVFPNMEEARAAAEKIAKGTTFATLAAERGLKDADFDLGTIAKSAIVDRKVADAAFALKQNEVSAPIEGRFGIALVQVSAIEPAQTKPFDAVAEELKRTIAAERAKAEVQTLYDKIEDERLSGTTLQDIAGKFNLKLRTIDAIDRAGGGPDGKPVPGLPQGVDLLSAVFTADVHGDHDPLRMTGGSGYVWFDVPDIAPSRERPLDEVKGQVEAGWRDDEIATRLRAKATSMVDRLKAGTPFAEVAAADKLKVEWLPGIKRGQNPASLSAAGVEEVFRTVKDAAGTAPGPRPASRMVFRVTEVNVPPLDLKSAEAKPIEETLSRSISEDIVAQYIVQLQSEVGVTINQNALNQITGGGTLN